MFSYIAKIIWYRYIKRQTFNRNTIIIKTDNQRLLYNHPTDKLEIEKLNKQTEAILNFDRTQLKEFLSSLPSDMTIQSSTKIIIHKVMHSYYVTMHSTTENRMEYILYIHNDYNYTTYVNKDIWIKLLPMLYEINEYIKHNTDTQEQYNKKILKQMNIQY